MTITVPGHPFHGAAVEGNGARGHRRGPTDGSIIWFCLHTYEGGSEGLPMERFLAAVATPAGPANRSFQSRDSSGRLQWETATHTRTTDPERAMLATQGGQVFRPPDAPLAVVKGVTAMPWCYGAAYHAFADADTGDGDYVLTADPTEWALNSQGGEEPNERTVSICLPGRSSRTRAEWLTGRSRKMIRGAARCFVDVSKAIPTIPNRRASVADLVARRGGYCGHFDFSRAFHKSNHGDPGPAFPWDVFAADIDQILQGDDMAQLVTTPGDPAAFEVSGTSARWIPDWDSLAWMWQRKLVAEKVTVIPRADLRRLHLSGPEPVAPSTTKGTEFATWNPAA